MSWHTVSSTRSFDYEPLEQVAVFVLVRFILGFTFVFSSKGFFGFFWFFVRGMRNYEESSESIALVFLL